MRSEWRLSTINEICSLVTDGAHNSPKSVINGAYMASVKDFTEYGLDFSSCRMISEEDYEKLRLQGCVPEFNDILVGKDGARYFEDIIIYKQPEKPALLSSIAILFYITLSNRPQCVKMFETITVQDRQFQGLYLRILSECR